MDVKLDERLKKQGFETIEPQPAEVQPPPRKFLSLSPINRRRLQGFRRNRRGFWSLWIFLVLCLIAACAPFIANDRPIVVSYQGQLLFPVFHNYPESTFGGFLATTDYRDPYVQNEIEGGGGWMVWPPIRYSYDTHNLNLPVPAPSPPWWTMSLADRCQHYPKGTADPNCVPGNWNWLGTDDQTRDVVARLIYGFGVSVAFGLILSLISSFVGVIAGAVQGYFGGWVDLGFQRFLEIWGSLPSLYILLIISSVLAPSFWVLLGIMLLFSWTSLVGVVRAEFLRGRNFEYINAARALGVSDGTIMFRHLLPNAMVATLTFLPFILGGSVTTLTALDYLGYGLPPGSASLGELLNQATDHVQAPWLGLTAFLVISVMLSLMVFIGEAVRDAFDPRKTFA